MEDLAEPLFDYQFRLIVIGDSTVGKSSLLKYFTDARFENSADPTIGADFYARKLEIKSGIKVKLQLWDTAGQERFRSITKSYYRNSVGVLLVYDITNRSSFDHLVDWLEEARFNIEPQLTVYTMIGHKADKPKRDRTVMAVEAQRFADLHGFRFFETSAVTGQNIENAFLAIAEDIYDMLEAGKVSVEDGWDGITVGYRSGVEHLEHKNDVAEKEKCC